MIRQFSGSGLTVAPSAFSPNAGLKWKVLQLRLLLTTSATAGTRRVIVGMQDLANVFDGDIVSTGNQTTISTTFFATLVHTNAFGGQVGAQQSVDIIITPFDSIIITASLISGDTFSYNIIVDEQPA